MSPGRAACGAHAITCVSSETQATYLGPESIESPMGRARGSPQGALGSSHLPKMWLLFIHECILLQKKNIGCLTECMECGKVKTDRK